MTGSTEFTTGIIRGKIEFSKDLKECTVTGGFSTMPNNQQFTYNAANAPDHRASFSGSGLPFPNQEIAFENTSSKGVKKLDKSMTFAITIKTPNSYYVDMGAGLAEPTVYIEYAIGKAPSIVPIVLRHKIPGRDLTYPIVPPPKNVESNDLTTQESLFKGTAYSYI